MDSYRKIKNKVADADCSLQEEEEVSISEEQLEIHFYSMMRMIITTISNKEESVKDIVKDMEDKHLRQE